MALPWMVDRIVNPLPPGDGIHRVEEGESEVAVVTAIFDFITRLANRVQYMETAAIICGSGREPGIVETPPSIPAQPAENNSNPVDSMFSAQPGGCD